VEEKPQARLPEKSDLINLCASLNAHGVRYMVVGGMAVINQGFLRATEDIDLLLERSGKNLDRVREAMEILPDKAIRLVEENAFDKYDCVRVGDEIMVDLMMSACGITYDEAQNEIEVVVIDGIPVPFASAKLLLRMKQTHRDKDIPDRLFLQEKIQLQSK
jgi:hypothetical protein